MLPVSAAVVWVGGWPFVLLVSVLSAVMFWEWHRMPDGETAALPSMYVGVAGCFLAPVLATELLYWDWTDVRIILLSGAGLVVLAAVLLLAGAGHRAFRLTGFIYIGLSGAAMAWLRVMPDDGILPEDGLLTVVWLFGVVVATDTAAYFTGRTLGGPKLAPRISPKKTWSGLCGGVVGAAIVGALFAGIIWDPPILPVALISGGFAVIAQIGDLAVSKAKRKFGVKDSSNLIPGHGGLLDRLDGFLAVSLVMAALSLAVGGGSPVTWR